MAVRLVRKDDLAFKTMVDRTLANLIGAGEFERP